MGAGLAQGGYYHHYKKRIPTKQEFSTSEELSKAKFEEEKNPSGFFDFVGI